MEYINIYTLICTHTPTHTHTHTHTHTGVVLGRQGGGGAGIVARYAQQEREKGSDEEEQGGGGQECMGCGDVGRLDAQVRFNRGLIPSLLSLN